MSSWSQTVLRISAYSGWRKFAMLSLRLNRQKQTGQALPLGLGLIMLGVLGSIILFNTGQMASEKARVTNAADAAVYSGLVWQARTLNFQAYTNRAMVANQVSIAQFVSLGSWTNYGRISARNLDTAIGWIPVVAPFTSALVTAMEAIETVVHNVASAAIPVISGVNTGLSVVQEAVFNASYVATPEVISAVVKANDDRYRARSTFSMFGQAENANQWRNLTKRYSDEEGLKRKADVIMDSRDAFTSNRGWNQAKPLPKEILITPVNKFQIIKEGKTELAQDGEEFEWRGKDSLSLHWKTWSCGFSGCGWKSVEIPMGWGSNYAEGDGACGGGRCNLFSTNKTGEKLADAEAEDLGSGYSGVSAYRSLVDLSKHNRDPRLTLSIEVDVANSGVRTAEKMDFLGSKNAPRGRMKHGIEPGMFYTQDAYAADSMAAMSAGEVFFKRPVLEKSDALIVNGKQVNEYANLFNPYWDVRLIDVDEAQRLVAWAVRSRDLAVNSGNVTGLARTVASVKDYNGNALRQVSNSFKGLSNAAAGLQSFQHAQDAATNSLQNYVEASGYGQRLDAANRFTSAGIDSEGLLNSAAQYASNRGIDSGVLNNALSHSDGLLSGAPDLAASLVASSALQNAIDTIYPGIDPETILGEDFSEDLFGENNALQAELDKLQSSVGAAQEQFSAALGDVGSQLQGQISSEVGNQLMVLEQELGGSLDSFGLDRDAILKDLSTGAVDVAAGLVQDGVTAAQQDFSGLADDLKDSLSERFSGIEVTPESIDAGVLRDARQFLSAKADAFTSAVDDQISALDQNKGSSTQQHFQQGIDHAQKYLDAELGRLSQQIRAKQEALEATEAGVNRERTDIERGART